MTSGYNTSVNKTRNKAYNYTPTQAPESSINNGDKTFNYSEIYSKASTNTSAKSTKNKQQGSTAKGVWGITMGQTQNFTLYINGLNEADNSFKLPDKGLALPLKSLDYKPVKLENMKIKAGIFNDLPFFHRKSMAMLSCTMLDSHKGYLSRTVFEWWDACIDNAGYAPYVSDYCKNAEYTEYTFDGKIANKYRFVVMPDGEISTSRTVGDEGALTEFKFNLIIVSDIINVATQYVETDAYVSSAKLTE